MVRENGLQKIDLKDLYVGRTWDIPTESQKNAKMSLQQAKLRS